MQTQSEYAVVGQAPGDGDAEDTEVYVSDDEGLVDGLDEGASPPQQQQQQQQQHEQVMTDAPPPQSQQRQQSQQAVVDPEDDFEASMEAEMDRIVRSQAKGSSSGGYVTPQSRLSTPGGASTTSGSAVHAVRALHSSGGGSASGSPSPRTPSAGSASGGSVGQRHDRHHQQHHQQQHHHQHQQHHHQHHQNQHHHERRYGTGGRASPPGSGGNISSSNTGALHALSFAAFASPASVQRLFGAFDEGHRDLFFAQLHVLLGSPKSAADLFAPLGPVMTVVAAGGGGGGGGGGSGDQQVGVAAAEEEEDPKLLIQRLQAAHEAGAPSDRHLEFQLRIHFLLHALRAHGHGGGGGGQQEADHRSVVWEEQMHFRLFCQVAMPRLQTHTNMLKYCALGYVEDVRACGVCVAMEWNESYVCSLECVGVSVCA
jgi:hypothetical protein